MSICNITSSPFPAFVIQTVRVTCKLSEMRLFAHVQLTVTACLLLTGLYARFRSIVLKYATRKQHSGVVFQGMHTGLYLFIYFS